MVVKWNPTNPQGNEWNILCEKTRRSPCKQKVYFDVSLQLGTQVYSYATSDENTRCKSSSGQGMEEARDDPSLEFGKSHEQKGSPLCHIDGPMSPQKKRGVKNTKKIQRQSGVP